MSRLALAHRERRVLLAGAAIMTVLIAVSRGVPVWLDWWRGAAASAAELVAEAERAEASLRALPEIRDSLARRGERMIALGPLLMGGATPAVAAGALSGLVAEMAAGTGVQLGSVQVRSDSAAASLLTSVTVRGTWTGDIRGTTQMLQALERGPKLLSIRELSISQPDLGAPGDRPEVLRVEFVIEALALPAAGGER